MNSTLALDCRISLCRGVVALGLVAALVGLGCTDTTQPAGAPEASGTTQPAAPPVNNDAGRATVGDSTDSPRKDSPMARKSYSSAPAMTIDAKKKFTATFDTTAGKIVVDLFADRAPTTVNNFVTLAKDGFYDGLTFHRVIADFMVQGGDPEGTGRGGPGYKWNDEKSALAIKHEVGSLAMANAGPNTNGSQFYITHIATDWLNGKHAVFGKVREGQDVVDKVKQGDKVTKLTITEE